MVDSKMLSRRGFLRAGASVGSYGALAVAGAMSPTVAGAPTAQGFPFTPNGQLMESFMSRRGGPIGTAGKVAVAFRCDHHLNKFQSMLLPLHRKYAIPVTVAAMSQMFGNETGINGSGHLSFSSLQELALENGLEVANHSATHTDAPTAKRLREEIAHSRDALSNSLPQLPIELFVPPGVGGTRYQGFEGGRSQSAFQNYLAGRLILQQHATSTGYVPGFWPMTGNPLNSMGKVHIGIENADYAKRGPDFVEAARKQGRGVCFMYHPSLVDDADLQAIEGFFAWCAHERDEGRMEILTTTGLMLSSFKNSSRHNLLSDAPSFSSGWHGWNGQSANWALRRDSDATYARRGARSTALFKDVAVGVHAGSARQLRIAMRSTTGTRVKIEVLDAAAADRLSVLRTLTLPPSKGFRPVHQYLILPLTRSPRIRVRVTPVAGGELHVREPELLAA